MKNQLLCLQVLFLFVLGQRNCENQSGNVTRSINNKFEIMVLEHQTNMVLTGVNAVLVTANNEILQETTDKSGVVRFDVGVVANGAKIILGHPEKQPVTINIDKKGRLVALGVKMRNMNDSKDNALSGEVTWINSAGQEVRVVNRLNTEENATTVNGKYEMKTSDTVLPFFTEYIRNNQTNEILTQMTISRSNGGSATIDVAFDDTKGNDNKAKNQGN